jgi:hypothetical protein
MVRSIKDERADRLAREQRRRGKHIDRGAIDAILAGIAALPVLDPRPPEELIGYDDIGLPRP